MLLHSVILQSEERAPQVPEDTACVPLEQWVKGHLIADAKIGETVSARTRTGRLVEGELIAVNPGYEHSFGALVPELLQVDEGIRKAMWGEESAE